MAPKRNSESAKLDYEPVPQWGPDGVDAYLTRPSEADPVKDNMREGDDQPDPFRHLDEKYVPKY